MRKTCIYCYRTRFSMFMTRSDVLKQNWCCKGKRKCKKHWRRLTGYS